MEHVRHRCYICVNQLAVSLKSLIVPCIALLLTIGFNAKGQAPRSATDRAALIHSYQISLREQASAEARELAGLLGLNESEIQLVREFATTRLQAEQEAQANNSNETARHALLEQAASTFQSRVVNILNDHQLQTYLNLLASQAPPPPEAPALVEAPAKAAAKAPAVKRGIKPKQPYRRSYRR